MNPSPKLRGVFSPVITPYTDDPRRSAAMMVRHCRWLLSQDVGLAVFGTNSEANSLGVVERMKLLDALFEAGVPGERMMPGTGCCALSDSVELTRHAVQHGVGGVLMLPPFFYKGVSDDGLFASYADVIERVADARLRIYLYHIPPVSQVPISLALIERLLKAYPGIVVGIKDSSGDWGNTKAMLERFQPQGFDVFAGSETFLLATMRAGGAGCITATGNVNPGAIAQLYRTWQQPDADAQQQALDAVRATFMVYPMIPALKAALAYFSGDAGYAAVRPPLVRLNQQQNADLLAALQATGFSMPGLSPGIVQDHEAVCL
jgi:4-hydroxy-tetrahydrodipicolinate synthase